MEVNDFTKGAILGALAGVLGGVFLAPKSSKKTREDLAENFEEIKDKVTDKLKEATKFSKHVYDRIVGETVAGYETAKKITPEDAAEISEIFEKSFADIEKVLKKDLKKISESAREKE